MSEARSRAAETARARLLLYGSGEGDFESIVRDTLRELGAGVEDPEAKGVEDRKLVRDEGQAVLEIKGRTGPISLQDVRQVVQWTTDAMAKDGVSHKPLIVGNPQCDKPLEERGEVLAPNAAAYADNTGVGVLPTTQLFEAFRQQQAGSSMRRTSGRRCSRRLASPSSTSRHPAGPVRCRCDAELIVQPAKAS